MIKKKNSFPGILFLTNPPKDSGKHSLHVGWRNRIYDSRFTWIHDFKE